MADTCIHLQGVCVCVWLGGGDPIRWNVAAASTRLLLKLFN